MLGEEDGVFAEHVPIVDAFLAVCSQWRTAAASTMAGARLVYLGLDYAGARAGLALAGIEATPDLWAGVQIMEAAAVAALNARMT